MNYDNFDLMAVRAADVREDDVYANGGTVTAVSRHPEPSFSGEPLAADEVRIDCGESFSRITHEDARVVVARRKATT